MWSTVGNISAIVTCFLFILYIIGHIWKAFITRHTKFEKFQIQELNENDDLEGYDNILIVDNIGETFSLSSSYGIRNIKIYEVSCGIGNDGKIEIQSKKLREVYPQLDICEPLYIRCDMGELMPRIQLEIERADYTKVTCFLGTSGKNGHMIAYEYSFKMTLKSFLYYLCI